MQPLTKRLIRWVVVVVVILLIPLVLTYLNPNAHINGGEGGGWDWSPFDFVFMGILLCGAALTYELVARKMQSGAYRAAVGLAVLTGVLLVWVNAAVGIIGDGDLDSPNALYFGVLAIGLVGALIARFQPRGMSYTLFAMALAQMLVPIVALIIGWNDFAPGVPQVFVLSAVACPPPPPPITPGFAGGAGAACACGGGGRTRFAFSSKLTSSPRVVM